MWGPTIEALRSLGGSGTPKEVIPLVLEKLQLSAEELAEETSTGAPRAENEIRWTSAYLKEAGYLTKESGVWVLTELGLTETPSIEEARKIRSRLHSATNKRKRATKGTVPVSAPDSEEETSEATVDEALHAALIGMTASGFERFCQLLLRKAGFEEVHVTGKTGDGGIDGFGTMRLSPFMSFMMIFQCKKYQGSVGPDTVRQMRGSMDGRTDKGLIITTGTFTREARREATREGVKQIELVDGTGLLDLMKQFGLGTKPITAYEVVPEFFEAYSRQ